MNNQPEGVFYDNKRRAWVCKTKGFPARYFPTKYDATWYAKNVRPRKTLPEILSGK